MRFLRDWKIDLGKIPAYVDFNTDFTTSVDLPLANLILEHEDERISPESREEFRKLVQRINPKTGELPVKYSPRKGGLGRRYPDCPKEFFSNGSSNPSFKKYYGALITMPRIIKNTLYHYGGWIDIDQVKGHPTLLLEIAKRTGERIPSYEDYLAPGRFDDIVGELSEFYSADPENRY
jgi:hypothetical protein